MEAFRRRIRHGIGALAASGTNTERWARLCKLSGTLLTVSIFSATGLFPGRVYGTTIDTSGAGGGILSISNLTGLMVAVSDGCIDWGSSDACQTATGVSDTVSGSDASDFTIGDGTIKNLASGTSYPLIDFQTVPSPLPGGTVYFDLTNLIIPGAFGDCTSGAVDNSCNPGGNSPFDFLQDSVNQVTVTFSLNEIAYTGSSTTGSTPYLGVFSTNLSGTLPDSSADTIPDILNYIQGGGTISSTWSAQESPVTSAPEPFTFVLLGSGLIGLALIRRGSGRARC